MVSQNITCSTGAGWINSRDPAARCWQQGSSSFHRKNGKYSAFAILIAIFNNDSSLQILSITVPTCADHFRIVTVPETKTTVFMTSYSQLGAILAICNGLRMCTTFYYVTGSQTPVLISVTYSSKSEIDETLRGDWPCPLRQVPARAHSIIAKHKSYFLQIVDYFAVLC